MTTVSAPPGNMTITNAVIAVNPDGTRVGSSTDPQAVLGADGATIATTSNPLPVEIAVAGVVAAVKAASTAPLATDPAVVVTISPNGQLSAGRAADASSVPVALSNEDVALLVQPYPVGQTPLVAASGNVANGSAAATLTPGSTVKAYITGFEVTATGATVGLPVLVTVAGILGGTLTYIFAAPAGALLIATPLIVPFNPPLPASAVNTAIVVTCPALGTGNTNAAVVAHGFSA
jgi:hypothetical protein